MKPNEDSKRKRTDTPAAGKTEKPPSFARGLFEGHLDEELILPYPQPQADEKENIDLLIDMFRKFADKTIDGAAIDEKGEMPKEVIDGLYEMGIMGMTIPEEYGGFGMSNTAYCRANEEITRYCGSTAATVGGHESLGYKGILLFGTPEQKQKFLPGCASGERLAAFALTEPTSGSDAASLKATAIHDPDRKVYVLNGTKRWITNGGLANLFTVFVRSPEAETEKRKNPITAFLVPGELPGVTAGKKEDKMGLRGSSTTDLFLENVEVPEDHLLGEKGRGFKVALEVLNTGRLSLSACCLGAAKEMIDRTVAHARERVQFGKPISEFEMIQDKISEMMAETFAAESMVYMTSGLADRDGQVDFSIESAICKVFVSEVTWRVIQHAVQVNGGNGYMREYPYERFLRDARVNTIFEGTNEILRLFIALSGVERRGRELSRVGKAIKEPVGSMGVLTDYAADRIKRAVRTERFSGVHPSLKTQAGHVEEYTRELAGAVDRILQKHGRKIIEREFLQQRIADAAADLYAMSCAIARTDARVRAAGSDGAEREMALCRLFCETAWRRVRRNLRQVTDNSDADRIRVSEFACADGGYRL